MSKKVLAIVSSPRKNGNTELLIDEFVKGAKAAGHETEKSACGRRRLPHVWPVKLACVTAVLVFRRMIWRRFCLNSFMRT